MYMILIIQFQYSANHEHLITFLYTYIKAQLHKSIKKQFTCKDYENWTTYAYSMNQYTH